MDTDMSTYVYGVVKYFEEQTTEASDPSDELSVWQKYYPVVFLIILSSSTLIGSLFNLLFIFAFRIMKMKKIGNAYLVAQGCLNLVVTLVVLPMWIAYINNEGEMAIYICHFMDLIIHILVYAESFFSVFTALGWAIFHKYLIKVYIPKYVLMVIATILLSCTLIVISGINIGFEYDFCKRKHHGNVFYRVITNLVMFFIPSCFALYVSLDINTKIDQDKPVRIYQNTIKNCHYQVNRLVLLNNSLFLICWAPYLLTSYISSDVSNRTYGILIFTGLIRPVLMGIVYGSLNKHFKRAYYIIFMRIIALDCHRTNSPPCPTTRQSASNLQEIYLSEYRQQLGRTRRNEPDLEMMETKF